MQAVHALLVVGTAGPSVWACGTDDGVTGASPGVDGGGLDGDFAFDDDGSFGGRGADGRLRCGANASCPPGDQCVHGLCQPRQARCVSNAGCQNDAYCDATGACVPYGTAPENRANDPACRLAAAPGILAPSIKCEFKPPAGDAFAAFVDVQSTPMVVNFNAPAQPGGTPPLPPSIIAPFTVPVTVANGQYTEDRGVIRVLRGTDCTLEANLGGVDLDANGSIDWARSSSPVALGDLDGDGVAEIVAFMVEESTGQETVVAFTRKNGPNGANATWAPLWPKKKATLADGATIFAATIPAASRKDNWGAPSIHDLDDDGVPEIIREGWVVDGATGKLRASPPAGYTTFYVGLAPVLANLDADPRVEMTNGAAMWEFDGAANAWVPDATYNAVTSAAGLAAVADFNPFDNLKKPEIVVAVRGSLTIYNLDHTVFMGLSVTVPGGGGGPPTIADYDGDGLPEVGVAGQAFYTVYDPDCGPAPRTGGKCGDRTHCDHVSGGACPPFILWSKATQDDSSNITGSSIFDFEADGKAEVVYADECFVRVYSGENGKVLFSQYRSSCTWLENPVVADVDGDFRAELVVPSNTACGAPGTGITCARSLDANGVDAQFAGVNCMKATDCVSGACDQGLCRCTATAQCCAAKDDAKCIDAGYKCAPPPAGTPGAGNTCRAARPKGVQGIRVYEDVADRWVRSRSIWNQHAYAVTHVNEDGTLPKTSAWSANWTTPSLNNFRQNVPGSGSGSDAPDLTAQAGPLFSCPGSQALMSVPICNRGSAPIGADVPIGFYAGATLVCATKTKAFIDVGKCEVVTCAWDAPPTSEGAAVDVTVKVNDGGTTTECTATNNTGLVQRVFCKPPT